MSGYLPILNVTSPLFRRSVIMPLLVKNFTALFSFFIFFFDLLAFARVQHVQFFKQVFWFSDFFELQLSCDSHGTHRIVLDSDLRQCF
jgi:hypothetical protein